MITNLTGRACRFFLKHCWNLHVLIAINENVTLFIKTVTACHILICPVSYVITNPKFFPIIPYVISDLVCAAVFAACSLALLRYRLLVWSIRFLPSMQTVRPYSCSCSCGMQCSSFSQARSHLSLFSLCLPQSQRPEFNPYIYIVHSSALSSSNNEKQMQQE